MPPMKKTNSMFNVADVAAYLKVCEKTVRRKIKSGELVATKVGSRIRVHPDDLNAYIARNSNRLSIVVP